MPQNDKRKIVVLIPAAGSGTRMGKSTKKQFLLLAGKPILAHTLKVFDDMPEICEIIPVLPVDEMEDCLSRCVEAHGIKKVKKIVPGGAQRQDSVHNGLKAVDPDTDIVLVHDGVRPFVTAHMIRELLAAVGAGGGAILAVPAKDTIKEVDRGGIVKRTLDRSQCYQVQTPQAFSYATLCKAFDTAYAEGFHGTDEASLVERCGGKVRVVQGSYVNIKITTPEDMILAEALLRKEVTDKAVG